MLPGHYIKKTRLLSTLAVVSIRMIKALILERFRQEAFGVLKTGFPLSTFAVSEAFHKLGRGVTQVYWHIGGWVILGR